MNITLRQLEAFVAVAQTKNFTRAAQRLHIAQSAISLLVKELESDLGIRLLDRPAFSLCHAATRGHDERLAERMRMPGRPRDGFKGDAGALHKRRIRRLK